MKKRILFYLLLLISLPSFLNKGNSRFKIFQGKATFVYTYPDSSEISKSLLSTFHQDQIIYFKERKSRIEATTDRMFAINDPPNDAFYSLIPTEEDSGIAIKSNYKELLSNLSMRFPKYKISIANEFKKIAGINCRKANVTYQTDLKTNGSLEIWFTKELPYCISELSFVGIDGFILQYSYKDILIMDNEPTDFRIVATCSEVIEMKLSDSLFQVPKNFHTITKSEFQRNLQIEYEK